LGIKNVGKLVPSAEDQKPKDPVSENMAVMNGKPVKAFIYQDHQAHIAVHVSAMQDPKIAAIIGQNPRAQVMQAALMAHINEHVAFEYRKQIEEMLGVPLPEMDKELPEEVEVEVSRMMAAAAGKLLQKDKAEVAQQQAQQTAQDPIVQMQQAELQLKAQELQLKQAKLAMDATEKADRIRIEEERIAAQKEIAGMQVGAKSAKDKADLDARMELEGIKLGTQIAREQIEMRKPQPKPAKKKE